MRETFSTKTNKDDLTTKRERLQSQGAGVKPTGITLDANRENPRKNVDELNQTIQVTAGKKFVDAIEVPASQSKKRDAGSEVPNSRRDTVTIDYVTTGQTQKPILTSDERARFTGSGPSPIIPNTTTATRAERIKGEILKTRMAKQSKSPD
jgi:archaellin